MLAGAVTLVTALVLCFAPNAHADRYATQRAGMVQLIRQDVIDTRRHIGREQLDPAVMLVMGRVPRHEFVPEAERARAYANHPLPIGYGQTISQPYIVALMTDLLALDARWVLIGLMGGREATLDLAKVLAKRISLLGSTLRTRDADFKATLLADMEQRLIPLFNSGELKPMVAKTFAFADAEAAFEELARDQVVGKVILLRED